VRPEPEVGLRERKKDATRRALAERALHLALQRGYQHFTITDLVADVGVSRRTFSNYFTGKAECVAAVAEGWLDDVLTTIREAPAEASLAEVLRMGLMAVARQAPERWARLQPLLDSEPEIAARSFAEDGAVIDMAAAEIAARSHVDAGDIRVRLLASFAVNAGREVLTRWVWNGQRGGEAALAGLLECAFSIIDTTPLQPPAHRR
jgi:AcrR family transcriptional regulator